jgi:hypothetical protein
MSVFVMAASTLGIVIFRAARSPETEACCIPN